MLLEGKPAPELAVMNQHKKQVRLQDFKGKWLVIYFYPKDFTPGCTVEGCEFTALYPEFQKRNAEVVGVSPDSIESHVKFAQGHKIEFTLLADTESKVCKAYSVWGQKQSGDKHFMGINRTTFIIGLDKTVKAVFRDVKPVGHAQEVLEKLKELQF